MYTKLSWLQFWNGFLLLSHASIPRGWCHVSPNLIPILFFWDMGFHLPCTDSRSFVGCSFMSTRHHLAPTKTNPCLKGFLIVSKPIKPWSPIIWLTQSYLAYLLPVSHSPSTNTRLWPHLIFFLCTTRVEFYCLTSKTRYMLWRALLPSQAKCVHKIILH